MANQITPEHENLFQQLLQTVDNHGARVTFQHVWDVLKEVVGVAVPVVEAAVPAAAPALQTVEEIGAELEALRQKYIAAREAQVRQQQAQSPSA